MHNKMGIGCASLTKHAVDSSPSNRRLSTYPSSWVFRNPHMVLSTIGDR